MERFKQKLNSKVKDEIAAFAILGAMIITFAITIGAFEYINHTKMIQTSTDFDLEESQEVTNSQENFETLENVTSQDDLKKLVEEDKKENKNNKNEKQNINTPKYYIKVNYGAQVVNIYTKDSDGKYTVPVKAMVCSTGTHTPTSGVYTIGYRWEWLEMIGSVYGHYVTQIYGDILFHSVPYLEKGNHSSLEWWAYDKLGTKASLGCVRLTTKDALWIFNNIASGTKVEFYSSSNPGPLGKPTARKISNAPNNIRGWDPTDPDSRNPWPKYLKELEDKEENDNENNTIEKNEITNEIVNQVTNEITNETANQVTNETVNQVTNEIANETANQITNEIVNETANQIANKITNETVENNIEETKPKVNEVNIKVNEEITI